MAKIYRIGSGKVITSIPIGGGVPAKDDMRCLLCGQIIVDSYYRDNYGNKACASHGDAIRWCKDCNRILSNGEGVMVDGARWICDVCYGRAVKDDVEARRIFIELIDEYKGIGITGFDPGTKIHVIFHRGEVIDVSLPPENSNWTGLTRSSYNGIIHSFEIFMLCPSHRLVFKSTLAHEMLHTWVNIHNIKFENASFEEGFCNLGSAWVLENSHSEIGRMCLESMEKDYDLRYGQGYRIMRNNLKKLGWKGLISSLKS